MAGRRRKNRQLARGPRTLTESVPATLTQTFETLETRLFRDGIQFCSGLVNLVVCVGGYLGGAHCLALACERFVAFVTKDSA
jgi:hypothetical protein